MAWIVRLVSLGADGAEHSTDVLRLAKPGDLADLASLGLSMAEGKRLLAGLRQEIVAAQARVHAARRPGCRSCGTACRVKDYRQHGIATLFGQVAVRLPRFRYRFAAARVTFTCPGRLADRPLNRDGGAAPQRWLPTPPRAGRQSRPAAVAPRAGTGL